MFQIWQCLGGLHTHVTTIVEALASRGAELYCVTEPRFLQNPLARRAVQTFIWDFELLTADQLGRFLSWCSELMARHQCDLVHLHGIRPSLAGSLAAAIAGVPYILTWHGFVDGPGLLNRLGPALSLVFTRITLPGAGKILAVKPPLAHSLYQAFRLSESQVTVFWNPVDCAQLDLPPADALRGPVATLVSQLIQSKERAIAAGMRLFAELVHNSPAWRLRVVGDGKLLDVFRRMAEDLRIPVEFLGFRHDVSEWVRESSVLVGMGRVILEAAAARRLAVIAGYDGTLRLLTPDLFRSAQWNNFNGEGLPAQDPASLAADLNRAILAGDYPAERLRSMVLRDHDAGRAAETLISLYRQVRTQRFPPELRQRAADLARHLRELGPRPVALARFLRILDIEPPLISTSPVEEAIMTSFGHEASLGYNSLPRASVLIRAALRCLESAPYGARLLQRADYCQERPRAKTAKGQDVP